MSDYNEDKPPSVKDNIRQPTSIRICSSPDNRSIAGRREVAFIQHLSSPDLSARFRDNLVILASS